MGCIHMLDTIKTVKHHVFHGFHHLPLLKLCNVLQFLLQKGFQLVFIVHQLLFNSFEGRLEFSNDILEEVVTDPCAQAEAHHTCQFWQRLCLFNVIFVATEHGLRYVFENTFYQIKAVLLHFFQSGSSLSFTDFDKYPFNFHILSFYIRYD